MASPQPTSLRGATPVIILFTLTVLGIFALLAFPISNGLFSAMLLRASQRKIGAESSPYDTTLTGWNWLDALLDGFTVFFYDLVDGSRADMSLLMIPFSGSAVGIWILGMIESRRKGNKDRIPAFFTTMASLGQILGLGIVSPLFYALSLNERNSSWRGSDYDVAPEVFYTTPISIVIGMALPWAIAALPAPSVLSINQKVNMVRLWEIFPITTYLVQRALDPLAKRFLGSTRQAGGRGNGAMHRVYGIGLLWSTASHWYFLSMVFSASVLPFIFKPEIAEAWSLGHMCQLRNPFALGSPLPSVSQGQLWFVQWDFWLISVACFVWALAVRLELLEDSARYSKAKIIVGGLMSALILGPVGAAVVLIWRRDTLVHKTNHRRKIV
ncbi:hypothetical protein H634G_04108 [Metarhizium anisopliae BRIP 53293]|uniref:Aflatrem synthesis protein A n=1 Tax=Metarhizium anisopliae BRIP 53293 TaxID=1291518 RepID=A0A0D9P0T1_METAN|nr:hypothetical protein H634G_04108 [Metarhizium anisopliae BRIP 53293]KJK95872.1 hypothetical protein H633G_00221 [Metarhizium anisopliae BRIP 53284]